VKRDCAGQTLQVRVRGPSQLALCGGSVALTPACRPASRVCGAATAALSSPAGALLPAAAVTMQRPLSLPWSTPFSAETFPLLSCSLAAA
jgi:hypothetical protein